MMKLPKELTTVTTTSKLLALALFVALPFAGFYLGIQYGRLSVLGSQGAFVVSPPMASSTAATSTKPTTTTPTVPAKSKKPPITQTRGGSGTSGGVTKTPIPTQPTTPPAAPSCYVSNCHGMAITCSPQPSTKMCTALYQLGDFCRQYEHCVALNNSCQVVQDVKYGRCTNCVRSCVSAYPNDSQKVSACESQCRTELASS